ncbi:MAG TPA: cytochrome c [Acidimicrobiales bacterium]|nr:cytochrome c [Acidimicrobiales bacterium]
MKRFTSVLQIVTLVLTAFFVVCLFTSQFPPWKSTDNGGSASAATTVPSTGTTAPGGAANTGAAGTTAAASTVNGQALYEDNCATCHGKTGGGGIGPSLKGIQKSLPNAADEEAIVKNGQGSMPGFGGSLSDEEIAAIVAYTRTLG